MIRYLSSAEITQGKLILLSGKRHENSFCTVVISFCPCHYKVIWGASALTIRKDVLVCLTRTRSLMIPYALWHSCLMPCVSFKSAQVFLQLPSGVWNLTPKLSVSFYNIWRGIIPFCRITHKAMLFPLWKGVHKQLINDYLWCAICSRWKREIKVLWRTGSD